MSGQELADYIVEHASAIAVRVQIDGHWENRYLTELPVRIAIFEALRLYERDQVPHRAVNPIDRDLKADVFSREPNGLIALRITQDEWNELLMVLGYKTGTASREADQPMFNMALRVVNRLNAGNPDFIPYEIPADTAAETQA